jgi:hypothetical protein
MLQIAHFVYPIVLIAITAQAQEAPDWARHYDNAFVSSPIVIDGLANERAWQLAPERGPYTRYRYDNLVPPHQTLAKMLWDQQYL